MELKYWALEDRNENGEYEIVSACETLTRPALMKIDGKLVETKSLSVGSVFTAAKYRGRSYAKDMMKDLVEWSDANNIPVAVLYSDVGEYYAQFGYKSVGTSQIKIDLNDKNMTPFSIPAKVEYITSDEQIKQLADLDMKLLRQKMESSPAASAFAIEPEAGVHIHTKWRALYLGPILGQPNKGTPTQFGAKLNQSQILWTQDYGAKTLYVTRLISLDNNVQDLVTLIQAAVNEAARWNLPCVCIWAQDIPDGLDRNQLVEEYKTIQNSPENDTPTTCYTHEREKSLPMYHVSPNLPQSMEWELCGKYAWF